MRNRKENSERVFWIDGTLENEELYWYLEIESFKEPAIFCVGLNVVEIQGKPSPVQLRRDCSERNRVLCEREGQYTNSKQYLYIFLEVVLVFIVLNFMLRKFSG